VMVISPLRMPTKYVILQLAIQSKCGIKCTKYEEKCQLLFSDHKTTSLVSN